MIEINLAEFNKHKDKGIIVKDKHGGTHLILGDTIFTVNPDITESNDAKEQL
jgi:hypothetical protein